VSGHAKSKPVIGLLLQAVATWELQRLFFYSAITIGKNPRGDLIL
jgi:hypothetical protein